MTWLGRCPAPLDSEHLPWAWRLWVSGVKTLVGLYLRGRPVAELRGLCKEQSSTQKGKRPRHWGRGAAGGRGHKPCAPHPGHRQPGPSASSPASLMAAKPALQPGSCPRPAPRGLRLSPALLSPSIRAAWRDPASKCVIRVGSGPGNATAWGGLGREENIRSRRLGVLGGSEKREWAVLL